MSYRKGLKVWVEKGEGWVEAVVTEAKDHAVAVLTSQREKARQRTMATVQRTLQAMDEDNIRDESRTGRLVVLAALAAGAISIGKRMPLLAPSPPSSWRRWPPVPSASARLS
ncbi:AUGMIN subunit 4 [Zea mays]|uniref:AUGMIN subunit 4 n=1 Tax=Zea mays TaxID=4577 RepID=B7ZXH2_MAIZE|nr:unknown [Zea mays]ONM28917.1 AUGMIN subunit 4 [Zea mays]ONM28922.1 AUGMIN subunit 4 [Zea mays]|eukprot:NP_001145804.1 uncharacterized protein LOC100279311 [Zea mays]